MTDFVEEVVGGLAERYNALVRMEQALSAVNIYGKSPTEVLELSERAATMRTERQRLEGMLRICGVVK